MNPITMLERILDQFEDDPTFGWCYYNPDPVPVVGELADLLDRTRDLVYELSGDEEGEE